MKQKKQPPRVQTRTVDKKPAFLAAYIRNGGNIQNAAEACEIDRSNHYQWLDSDPEYVKAFDAAKVQARDVRRDSAQEWAMVGIFEPLVYQGRFQYEQRDRELVRLENGEEIDVATHAELEKRLGIEVKIVDRRTVKENFGPKLGIYRRSEALTLRWLKADFPDEFGDKLQTELTGKDGGAIEIGIVERLNAARARLAKLR